MTINGQNFEIYQGDNKTIVITVRDASGGLVDLTGYDAVWCVHNITSGSIFIQKTTTPPAGITIPNPSSGEIVIDLAQVDTANAIVKTYGHQCEISDSLGNHATITTGYMKILRSITHPI